MCQCYQIGGPFIAEDPDCPVHGHEAQSRRDEVHHLEESDLFVEAGSLQIQTEDAGTFVIPLELLRRLIR